MTEIHHEEVHTSMSDKLTSISVTQEGFSAMATRQTTSMQEAGFSSTSMIEAACESISSTTVSSISSRSVTAKTEKMASHTFTSQSLQGEFWHILAQLNYLHTSLSSWFNLDMYFISVLYLRPMFLYYFPATGTPPKIEALPEDICIEEGKVLTVACAFSGMPLDIEWSHLGKTLLKDEHSNRFHIETTEDLTTLIISGVKEKDSGAYTLKLTNELGSDTATVHISIRSM